MTSNPSKFFPLEAATDKATYGRPGDRSALIDSSDIEPSAGPIWGCRTRAPGGIQKRCFCQAVRIQCLFVGVVDH